MNTEALAAFCAPYYADKDIMHNLWHIELTEKWVRKLIDLGNYKPDQELLTYALYFHGFIYSNEPAIRRWLTAQNFPPERIEKIVKIAWESQRPEIPETLEGKILHDAHILEGGKTYLVTKTLITGSVRGQNLRDTLNYLQTHVIDRNHCCLPEAIPLLNEMMPLPKLSPKPLKKVSNKTEIEVSFTSISSYFVHLSPRQPHQTTRLPCMKTQFSESSFTALLVPMRSHPAAR